MDSPIIAAQKTLNQNIAENELLDKMDATDKDLLDLRKELSKLVEVVENTAISDEEAQKHFKNIYKKQEEYGNRIKQYDEMIEAVLKQIKENNERISTLEDATNTMMETEDETKTLLNNAKSIFMRFDKLEEKIKKNEEKSHHEHITIKEYLEDRIDKQFFYLYLLFGITIVATVISIFVHR